MSKKNTSTVSYVIRTKNEGRFIGKVLKLVYQQTFKDFEVIIVDSGSTDSTLEKIKKYPVRLIKIKPKEFNYSYALNLGIKYSKGKYICIISGHSIVLSDTWLEDGLKNFEDLKVAGVTGYLSKNYLAFVNRAFGKYDFMFFDEKEFSVKTLTNTNAIIRQDLWEMYPFDEKLDGGEDYDWACEMLARGYEVIKDKKFSSFHSHIVLGRKPRLLEKPTWKKWTNEIDKRERPRKSYTKLKI